MDIEKSWGETKERSMLDGLPAFALFRKVGEPSFRRRKLLSRKYKGICWPTWQVWELPHMGVEVSSDEDAAEIGKRVNEALPKRGSKVLEGGR